MNIINYNKLNIIILISFFSYFSVWIQTLYVCAARCVSVFTVSFLKSKSLSFVTATFSRLMQILNFEDRNIWTFGSIVHICMKKKNDRSEEIIQGVSWANITEKISNCIMQHYYWSLVMEPCSQTRTNSTWISLYFGSLCRTWNFWNTNIWSRIEISELKVNANRLPF